MPSFVDLQYDKLETRKNRVIAFFGDLDNRLQVISAPTTYHLDIYWDGNFVRVILTDAKLAAEPYSEQLKYYNQGLGLMKIAMNKQLYS